MKAFHSTWTKPFFRSHEGDFFVEDFELLTTILSALKWREFNGEIKMITDKVGATYYKKLGLEELWDLGIDDTLEDEMELELEPSVFWAAGKLYALAKEKMPCVMLDTDFIIWENIEKYFVCKPITVIHRERLLANVYPDQHNLNMKEEYTFPAEWNWEVTACNTALLCIQDEAFKEHYVQEAKRFMLAALGDDALIYMVFAEQRLLAMCAEEKNIDIYSLSNLEQLFHPAQNCFTHVWGHKRLLRNNPEEKQRFCKTCIKRIEKDYPYFYPKLSQIESLSKYLD